MKALVLVLAGTLLGATAASADSVTIKHQAAPGVIIKKHRDVVHTGTVGCKTKTVDKINDAGEHVHKKVRKC